MGVGWSDVGSMSRVVVVAIDDDTVWAVGEVLKVECDARHQGHCETCRAKWRGDRAVRSQERGVAYDRYR
jgi:hypothetical protein